MAKHHTPQSKSSPLSYMQCRKQDGFKLASGHGKQKIQEEQEMTSQAAGCTQANKAVQISKTLDNLANAVMADKRTVEHRSKANKELVDANKELTSHDGENQRETGCNHQVD
eukprot:303229-Ditylum_brightwellii.AAC.1